MSAGDGSGTEDALNIAAFPDDQLGLTVLERILAGGAERVAEAGAVIVGGQTVRDAEIKYGLAVTGIVGPDTLLTNSRAARRCSGPHQGTRNRLHHHGRQSGTVPRAGTRGRHPKHGPIEYDRPRRRAARRAPTRRPT